MRKNYIEEKIITTEAIMLIVGLLLLIYVTYFRITSPQSWSPYGYLIFLGFMIVWTGFIGAFYIPKLLNNKEFIKKRNRILSNGKCYNGHIIDKKTETTYKHDSDNGKTIIYHYYVLVSFNLNGEDIEYWTPELNFSHEKIVSNDVKVYVFENEYYVDGFVLK